MMKICIRNIVFFFRVALVTLLVVSTAQGQNTSMGRQMAAYSDYKLEYAMSELAKASGVPRQRKLDQIA